MKYTTITHKEYEALKELSKKEYLIVDNSDNKNYYGLLQPFVTKTDFEKNGDTTLVNDYNAVNNILKKHIPSLVSFSNFTKDGIIRFQHKYDVSFTGVGYITFKELFRAGDIKDYISDLIGVELISTFEQNERITKECKEGKREFYKGFTFGDSISANLIYNGFKPYSNSNDNYSNEYHKIINGYNITVSYIEGDVYLNIFLDNDCFNDYKLY